MTLGDDRFRWEVPLKIANRATPVYLVKLNWQNLSAKTLLSKVASLVKVPTFAAAPSFA